MPNNYYDNNRKKILKRLNDKYKKDEKFREKVKSKSRERYQNDPDYKKSNLERAKARYYKLKKQTLNKKNK